MIHYVIENPVKIKGCVCVRACVLAPSLAVSLTSCRGAPIPQKGGRCCAPVGSASLSLQLCFDIKRVSMLQRGEPTRSEATHSRTDLVPGRYSSFRGPTDGQRNLAVGIDLSDGAKNY